ncbi:MAG: DUF6069 family protein [Jatrophihabitantaceae bacterium]
MTADTTTVRPRSTSAGVIAAGVLVAIIVSVALNAAVAAIAHAAGASHEFEALEFGAYTFLTIIGILVATAVWALIRARASNPRKLLSILVPAVVAVSLVPDVLVGAQGDSATPGVSWGAMIALMSMHLIITAVTVPILLRVLPLPADRADRDR